MFSWGNVLNVCMLVAGSIRRGSYEMHAGIYVFATVR